MAKVTTAVQSTKLDDGPDILPPKEIRLRSCHWYIFRKNITWRVISTLISAVLVLVILYVFAAMANVDAWDRRLFSMLTILFPSLVSLSVGSLIGFLGSMMRWPLLANKSHSPLDVDLVLGMQNPTGSLRLVANHYLRGHWTTTTTIVLAYLLFNIVGRLSVATFGLTFDLNEEDAVEYPAMVTDWGSSSWLDVTAESFHVDELGSSSATRALDVLSVYTRVGGMTAPIEYGGDWIEGSETKTKHNISGRSIDGSVQGQTVIYSYPFREMRGLEVHHSEKRFLRSSAQCSVRQIRDLKVYEHGRGLVKELPYSTNFTADHPDYDCFWILERGVPFKPVFNKSGAWAFWATSLQQSRFVDESSNCSTVC
ncbi:hypothetical protein B0T14DRAFT_325418 [Immersiella caudata]|uniref:Uncharacterized protein n=1 Tax=Immersiella caudata TaxID=314043 RepID=A0AA39T1M2_9PEZI|nr:hypothetical protein B0T14DRAFT_325418 [Immersiella caudata]